MPLNELRKLKREQPDLGRTAPRADLGIPTVEWTFLPGSPPHPPSVFRMEIAGRHNPIGLAWVIRRERAVWWKTPFKLYEVKRGDIPEGRRYCYQNKGQTLLGREKPYSTPSPESHHECYTRLNPSEKALLGCCCWFFLMACSVISPSGYILAMTFPAPQPAFLLGLLCSQPISHWKSWWV